MPWSNGEVKLRLSFAEDIILNEYDDKFVRKSVFMIDCNGMLKWSWNNKNVWSRKISQLQFSLHVRPF